MNQVILHVTYTCRAGAAEQFVSALKESGLQSAVCAEAGCLQYDYHLSCEAPDTVVLLEHWESAEALAVHAAQPHMAQIMALKDSYVLHTKVEKFRLAPSI